MIIAKKHKIKTKNGTYNNNMFCNICSNKLLILKHYYLLIKLKDECGTLLIAAVLRHVSTKQQHKKNGFL